MLYSIGYEGRSVLALINELRSRRVNILVDVRSKPFSRKPGFSKQALEKSLEAAGLGYLWLGKTLGGFGEIAEGDIRQLATWQEDHTACLMCFERDPKGCHRDYNIARRLKKYGVRVRHIKDEGCIPPTKTG